MNKEKDNDNRNIQLEEELIKRLKQGDSFAFETIYHLYFQRLYIYCFQFTKSQHDSEDIVQEVFAKLWLNRSKIKQETSIRNLLFTIARNDIISAFRRTAMVPFLEDYMDFVNEIPSEDSYNLEYAEFEQQIMQAIDNLSPARRNILNLSRFCHLSNKEIAKKLGINEQSVKNSITQSLKIIKSHIRILISIPIFICLFHSIIESFPNSVYNIDNICVIYVERTYQKISK